MLQYADVGYIKCCGADHTFTMLLGASSYSHLICVGERDAQQFLGEVLDLGQFVQILGSSLVILPIASV
jgi:hypothetical protein